MYYGCGIVTTAGNFAPGGTTYGCSIAGGGAYCDASQLIGATGGSAVTACCYPPNFTYRPLTVTQCTSSTTYKMCMLTGLTYAKATALRAADALNGGFITRVSSTSYTYTTAMYSPSQCVAASGVPTATNVTTAGFLIKSNMFGVPKRMLQQGGSSPTPTSAPSSNAIWIPPRAWDTSTNLCKYADLPGQACPEAYWPGKRVQLPDFDVTSAVSQWPLHYQTPCDVECASCKSTRGVPSACYSTVLSLADCDARFGAWHAPNVCVLPSSACDGGAGAAAAGAQLYACGAAASGAQCEAWLPTSAGYAADAVPAAVQSLLGCRWKYEVCTTSTECAANGVCNDGIVWPVVQTATHGPVQYQTACVVPRLGSNICPPAWSFSALGCVSFAASDVASCSGTVRARASFAEACVANGGVWTPGSMAPNNGVRVYSADRSLVPVNRYVAAPQLEKLQSLLTNAVATTVINERVNALRCRLSGALSLLSAFAGVCAASSGNSGGGGSSSDSAVATPPDLTVGKFAVLLSATTPVVTTVSSSAISVQLSSAAFSSSIDAVLRVVVLQSFSPLVLSRVQEQRQAALNSKAAVAPSPRARLRMLLDAFQAGSGGDSYDFESSGAVTLPRSVVYVLSAPVVVQLPVGTVQTSAVDVCFSLSSDARANYDAAAYPVLDIATWAAVSGGAGASNSTKFLSLAASGQLADAPTLDANRTQLCAKLRVLGSVVAIARTSITCHAGYTPENALNVRCVPIPGHAHRGLSSTASIAIAASCGAGTLLIIASGYYIIQKRRRVRKILPYDVLYPPSPV